MKEKKEYWQSIRGICILAVILIHSLGGFNYLLDMVQSSLFFARSSILQLLHLFLWPVIL